MQGYVRLLFAASAVLPTACATPGGGSSGFVLFDPKHHVSGAEPLFGDNDERCLDDPTFMLTLFAPSGAREDEARVDVCTRMKRSIGWGLQAHGAVGNGAYDQRGRNEVIDGLMAASDRKCGRYINFLQQYDGNVNATFGIGAQAAAILATVVSAGAAPWFAAGAGIAGGTRGTLNEAHFNNQTIGVLANAFENVRREQREAIALLEAKKVEDYSIMRGIEDATRYHASCTIVVGLKEAQRDVEAARSPNLDTFKKMVKSFDEVRKQFADVAKKMAEPAPANPGGETPEPAPSGMIDVDGGPGPIVPDPPVTDTTPAAAPAPPIPG